LTNKTFPPIDSKTYVFCLVILKIENFSLDVKKFCATVKLITSVHRGEVIQKVDYEHISKLHPQ